MFLHEIIEPIDLEIVVGFESVDLRFIADNRMNVEQPRVHHVGKHEQESL